MQSENKLAGLGLLTAFLASICCITPALALLAGTSILSSSFSWLTPLRPYLVGITLLLLGLAWYKKLKPQNIKNCNCDKKDRTSFVQTKIFLGIVTAFSGLMLAFPDYAHILFYKEENKTVPTERSNLGAVGFTIGGMTCKGCEDNVIHELNKLSGIVTATVSYKNENAVVAFDKTKTNISEIENAITAAGYSITYKKEVQ